MCSEPCAGFISCLQMHNALAPEQLGAFGVIAIVRLGLRYPGRGQTAQLTDRNALSPGGPP